jgi:hypothetical protein
MSTDPPHTAHEENYESISSTTAFSFGFLVIGGAVVATLIAVGCLWTRFPLVRKPPVWVGAGMLLFLMAVGCRTLLFGKSQLQIGKDRLRIVNAWGAVTDEIHYGAIAAVKLVRKTAVAEPEGNPFEKFAGRGLLGRGLREIMREPQVAFAITQQHLLGIRFHDADTGKVDRQELATRARMRGNFQGCDWVLPATRFAPPSA